MTGCSWPVCKLAARGRDEHSLIPPQKVHVALQTSSFVKPAVSLPCWCVFGMFCGTHALCCPAGFTVADTYSPQTQFPAVQQLQDSSTLESQALSTSFHQQNLLPVPSSDPIGTVSPHRGHPTLLSVLFCPRCRPSAFACRGGLALFLQL